MIRPSRRATILTTERTMLRPAITRDHTCWAGLRATSRAHLEPWDPTWPVDALSRADWKRRIKAWQTSWRQGISYDFLIWLADGETLIGGIRLTNIRRGNAGMAGLGYWLGEPFAGQGLMQEAAGAVCDWTFSQLGLDRIEAGTLPENTSSRALLTRLGFEEEGLARAYLKINGKRRDHVLYGLVRPGAAH